MGAAVTLATDGIGSTLPTAVSPDPDTAAPVRLFGPTDTYNTRALSATTFTLHGAALLEWEVRDANDDVLHIKAAQGPGSANHGLASGHTVQLSCFGTGAFPAAAPALDSATPYYARVLSPASLTLHTTKADALPSGTGLAARVDVTSPSSSATGAHVGRTYLARLKVGVAAAGTGPSYAVPYDAYLASLAPQEDEVQDELTKGRVLGAMDYGSGGADRSGATRWGQSLCPPGFRCPAGVRLPCAAGRYSSAEGTAGACAVCSPAATAPRARRRPRTGRKPGFVHCWCCCNYHQAYGYWSRLIKY